MIQVTGEKAKKTIENLIFNEFHKDGDSLLPHQIEEKQKLILTALHYGLIELAMSLQKDLE